MQRLKYWVRLIRLGYSAAPAIGGLITCIVGGSVVLVLAWGLKHLAWGIVLLIAAVVVTILEGAYREALDRDEAHRKKLEEIQEKHASELTKAQAKPAGTVHAPVFWNTKDTNFIGSEVNNTYAPGDAKPEQKGSDEKFVTAEDVEFGGGFVNVHYGPPPPLPPARPSTSEERILLRKQLLELASTLEEVTAPWRMSSVDTAKQMGIPDEQFMERMGEVRSEMRKVEEQITDRYIRECRLAVMGVYGHARSIGLADPDMETRWQSSHSGAVSHIHETLRAIAARIHD